MNGPFKVGEIVLYVRPGSPRFGEECTIVSGYRQRNCITDHLDPDSVPYKFFGYRIRRPNGDERGAKPEWLRRKPPKQDDLNELTSWDKVRRTTGWVPQPLLEEQTA